MQFQPIAFLRWAKAAIHDHDGIDLASSGVRPWTLDELSPPEEALELQAPNVYGLPELREALAEHYGVAAGQVLIAAGSSAANFLVAMTHLSPGMTVLVEEPVYEPLLRLPELFGCSVRRIVRPDSDWTLDPAALDDALARHRAQMVLLTNPHNPSGVLLPVERLAELHDVCERRGALLLCDEVYADLRDHDPKALADACASSLVRTSSLTKVMGFGGLRVGWAVGPERLIERAWLLNDYISVINGTINERLAHYVWEQRSRFLDPAVRRAAFNLDVMRRFLATRTDLEWVDPQGGIIGFVRVPALTDTSALAGQLHDDHGVRVVPGSFFERPSFLRIGFGQEADELRQGLTLLGRTLDTFGR